MATRLCRRQQSAVQNAVAQFANNSHFAYVDLVVAIELSNPGDVIRPTAGGNNVFSSRPIDQNQPSF
jgi:hypothetical protein